MGRHKANIDVEKVRTLAALGLTMKETAAILDCSDETIRRRFSDVMHQGWARRDASVRRKQFEIAMQGNPTMLVWLGKQYLDRSDKQDVTHGGEAFATLAEAIGR